MNDQIYDDITLEKSIKAKFGLNLEIDSVVARHIPISRTGEATLFLNSRKQLFLFITAESKLILKDVRRIVSKMNLKAESYVTPKGRPSYFDDFGRDQFKKTFPGRTYISDDDIAYYRTLTPYNPALVLISEVIDGEVRQFDSDSHDSWRTSVKFSYRRLKTS